MSPSVPARILVVDDNPKIHEDFAKVLLGAGRPLALLRAEQELFGVSSNPPPASLGAIAETTFELDFAHSGHEALDLAIRASSEGRPYAVVFMDIRMPPGWDGIRTTSEIWSVDPHVQVVFCTAYSDYSWDDMVERLGTSDGFLILKKPFDTIEVRQFAHALTKKWSLEREKAIRLEELERQVTDRTAALANANAQLRSEMVNRERAEKSVRHLQKMEALGRLAAGVGHEINNPLTFILANVESSRTELATLAEDTLDPRVDEVIGLLQEAESGLVRIATLVRQLRVFSHPGDEVLGPVELRDCVEAAVAIAETSTAYRGLVRVDLGAPVVLGDSPRLQQVLVNLLVNAIQAQPDGKSAPVDVVSRWDGDSGVVLEVRDCGKGIAPSDLERVFDPFFTTKRAGEGSGLGLSICRGIVESFGGKIELDSAVGRGTTVRLRLRAVPLRTFGETEEVSEIRSRRRGPSPPEPSHNKRILVVDDEPAIRRGLARALRAYEVTAVESGREAVRLYHAEPYDLVVCDLVMPEIDGMDVHEALAAMGPEHAARLVFVTGGVFTPRMTDFLKRTTNQILQKPLDLRSLAATVQAVFDASEKGTRRTSGRAPDRR